MINVFLRGVVFAIEQVLPVNTPNREESQQERKNFTLEQLSCYEKIVKTLLELSEQSRQASNKTYTITFRTINREGLEESIVSCQETIGNNLKQIQLKHLEYKKLIQEKKEKLEQKEDSKLTAIIMCQRIQRYIDDNWNKLTNMGPGSLTRACQEWAKLEDKALEFDPEKSETLTEWKEYCVNHSAFVRCKLEQIIKVLEALKSQITVTIEEVEPNSSQFNPDFSLNEEIDAKIKGTFEIIEEQQVLDGSNSQPRKKFTLLKKPILHAAASMVESSDESTEESTSSPNLKSTRSTHSLIKMQDNHFLWEGDLDSDQVEKNNLDKVMKEIVIEALAQVNRTLAGDPKEFILPYNVRRTNVYDYGYY